MLRELSSRLQMAGKDCKRVAAELHLWINTYGAELRAMSRRTKSQSTTEVFKHRKAEFEQLTKLFMQQLMTCAADPAVRAAIERMGQVVR